MRLLLLLLEPGFVFVLPCDYMYEHAATSVKAYGLSGLGTLNVLNGGGGGVCLVCCVFVQLSSYTIGGSNFKPHTRSSETFSLQVSV